MTRYHCPLAWTGEGFVADLVLTCEGGLIVETATGAAEEAVSLPGVAFPGFANTHSHTFHRLLRGETAQTRGDFWAWRRRMYDVASTLDPDSYRATALAAFSEMVEAGYTSVCEFHYLHHQPDGRPYQEPNVMADALADAAAEAGIRLTLLDTCYLSAGFGLPPEGAQLRFADPSVEAWAERASAWNPPEGVTLGAAIHSVRAVNPRQMEVVAAWAGERPLHVHLSEQRGENRDCLNHYGRTPTQVLSDAGVLETNLTVVHATHLAPGDISLLGSAGVAVAVCPTTERWLADGIGPTGRLSRAGARLRIGSDSQAVIDPFEETRLLELHQRLLTNTMGTHLPGELLSAGTAEARLAAGFPADLVTVDEGSPRNREVEPPGLVFTATAADVRAVVVGGRRVR